MLEGSLMFLMVFWLFLPKTYDVNNIRMEKMILIQSKSGVWSSSKNEYRPNTGSTSQPRFVKIALRIAIVLEPFPNELSLRMKLHMREQKLIDIAWRLSRILAALFHIMHENRNCHKMMNSDVNPV